MICVFAFVTEHDVAVYPDPAAPNDAVTTLLPIWGPKFEPLIVTCWFPAVFIVVVATATPVIAGEVYLRDVEYADVV